MKAVVRKSGAAGFRKACITFVVLAEFLGSICAWSQATTSPPSRPILFVHGICANAYDAEPLFSNIYPKLNPSLYPSAAVYIAQFNSVHNTIQFWVLEGAGTALQFPSPVNESDIPSNARFFSIMLYDPIGNSTDAESVAKISILNKAYEVSQVIKHITAITHVKDVIVLGHSMGGLDTRAYIENLASQGACYDYNNNTPHYAPDTCKPGCDSASCMPNASYGTATYAGDIGDLITIDTPHSGTPLASLSVEGANIPLGCFLGPKTNTYELEDAPSDLFGYLINALNYSGQSIANEQPTVNTVPIQAIQDYLTDVTNNTFWPLISGESDDVVPVDSQGIPTRLQTNSTASVAPQLTDVPISYSSSDIANNQGCFYQTTVLSVPVSVQVLHFMSCLGTLPVTDGAIAAQVGAHEAGTLTSINVNATLDGKPWTGALNYQIDGPGSFSDPEIVVPNTVSDVPLGTYSISHIVGGPPNTGPPAVTVGPSAAIQQGQWSATFTLAFSSQGSTTPSVTTLAASSPGSDGATLNGTVNPNGSTVTAWFEYGISSTLATFQSTTPVQSIPAGIANVSVSFPLTGQSANTTYYYRLAASNGTTIVRGTPIFNFTTLNTLPRPTLLTPANVSNGVSLTPQLSWTTVPNAASYRVIMSTSQSALPTDPNSSTCTFGCVLGSMGIITSGTTLTPSAGQLSPSTQYFWEVHGRSATQAGDWSSPIWSFTTASAVSNDFSIQVSPSAQSVSQGSSAAYNVVTATTSGSSQSVSLSASNLPSGLSATFSPATVTSGSQSTLTLSASASAPVGTYTLVIAAASSNTTHTSQISVTIVQAQTGPVMTVTPSIVRFNDQTDGTISSPQNVVLRNSGTGQLIVTGIGLASGNNDYALNLSGFSSPLILNQGVTYTLQVFFEPIAAGSRPGQIVIYDNAPGSPQIVSLTGNGLAAQPTTGTINVNATLNGIALPALYFYQYSLTGPTAVTGYDSNSFSVTAGTYSIAFGSNPSNFTLASVTPSPSQPVVAGGTTTFTLNFSAPNDFYPPFFGVPSGSNGSPQIVSVGQSATYIAQAPYPPGNASTPITLSVAGVPAGAIADFNPEPAFGTSTLTITTDPAKTPLGVYALTLSGTNSSGLTHIGAASSLAVTAPPSTPVQLVSQSSTSVQGNLASGIPSNSVTPDGRFVTFVSGSTNLVTSDTSGHSKVLLRDLQSGTSSEVSVSTSGIPADSDSYGGAISANGQYVAFTSSAGNLYPGSVQTHAWCGVYVRDLVQGITEREDVAPDGTAGNADSCTEPAISADGRFVAFGSDATNVISGTSGMQVYLRDRKAGRTTLISTATDGSAGNGFSAQAGISADGRYISFLSSATNLVSQNTSGLNEAFVRDTEDNLTSLVSISSDGQPANASVSSAGFPLVISADGHYVVFASSATNLAPHPTDYATHVFLYDRQIGQTTLADVDSVGTPLGGGSFSNPAISPDGRFIAFSGFTQVLIRDTVGSQTAVVSVAANGQPDNNTSADGNSYLSLGGSRVAFASFGTNLVANDTNGQADAFVASNPFVGSLFVKSISLGSAFVPGGSALTGTLTLTGAAPTGGAVVSVWSNNTAAQAPGTVTIPAGATSAQFSLNTSLVDAETAMTIMGSYNGGSSVAVLTLEPAAQLSVNPAFWDFGNQALATNSPSEGFVLTNSGTAALTITSIQLLSGQVFSISSNTCGSSVAVGANCSVSVVFKPSASGSISDTLQVSYGSPATIQSVSLTGNGATPQASLSPGTLTLTSPANTTATIALTNGGNAPLSSISATIAGANAGDFSISSDGCSGVILPANNSCLIAVVFSPKASGTRLATLSLADNASGSPQTIALTGSVVQATPAVLWSPSATSITYGTSLGAGILNASASLNGNSVAGTFAYSAAISSVPLVITPTTVLGAGVYVLTATFTPTDTTDYATAMASTSFAVNRATPTITWNLPTTMTYGSPLGSGQLNATASVAGTFAYSPGPGTILTAGTSVLVATFTPSDSADYNGATATFTITVNPATPTITWSPPAPIATGTALSSTQLNARSSIPGTFIYSPPAGAVLSVGSHVLSVAFTPSDTTDYTTAVATVSITVGQTTPTITWSNPVPVVYGTSLTALQLNAVASVPGTLAYSPVAGTVLTAGTHTSDAAVLTFPHSASNANRAFRTLSRILRLAVEWKVLRASPRIKLLEEHGRTALIESSTEALLLQHAPQPLADVLVTIMDCGMRPEEVMRMRKEHIYWDRSVVLVPYGKSFKSKRYVSLSDRMHRLLLLRKPGDSPWVFPSKRAGCGHLTTINKQWTATVEAVNLAAAEQKLPPISPALKPYCARHTFATDMLAEGMNLVEVMGLLGHEDAKTTMKYLHPDTSGSAAIVNQRNRSKSLHLLKAAG